MMPARINFLRSPASWQGRFLVRDSAEADLPAVERLMRRSPRTYSGYGGAMKETLREDLFLTAWQEEKLAGFVMAHGQGPQVIWIYAFGLAEDAPAAGVGQALLEALAGRATRAGLNQIAYMDEFRLPWLRRVLSANGFRRHTHVVSYEATATDSPDLGNRAVQVRPAGPTDIPAIAELDQLAFGTLWAYRESVLHTILGQTGCFDVALQGGQIVGYVLATLHEGQRGHIVRLAVHPRHQGQGIGTRLLAATFRALLARGIKVISLNTQEENLRSQRLYRRFGFRPTGDEMEVWVRDLRTPPSPPCC